MFGLFAPLVVRRRGRRTWIFQRDALFLLCLCLQGWWIPAAAIQWLGPWAAAPLLLLTPLTGTLITVGPGGLQTRPLLFGVPLRGTTTVGEVTPVVGGDLDGEHFVELRDESDALPHEVGVRTEAQARELCAAIELAQRWRPRSIETGQGPYRAPAQAR